MIESNNEIIQCGNSNLIFVKIPWTKATEENWPGSIETLYEKYNLHHPNRKYKNNPPPDNYPTGGLWYDEANTGIK
jgi:hypothetical protein